MNEFQKTAKGAALLLLLSLFKQKSPPVHTHKLGAPVWV